MAESLTDDQQHRRRQAVAEILPTTPFLKGLGIVFERYEPDDVTIRLPWRADLTNDGAYFHGGIVASVLDTTGAATAWSNHDFDKGTRAATVSMTVQYVGAPKRSDLVCHGRTVRRRKELVFTEITATDSDGTVVAHAVQTYR
ncbi:MAG TPA: PaaI family thioesterase, partial [Mycobacterium sp.]|nr:PaaI family thioesterase [Mycobacterium sp.]